MGGGEIIWEIDPVSQNTGVVKLPDIIMMRISITVTVKKIICALFVLNYLLFY